MDKDKWTPDDEFWTQTSKTPPQPENSGNAEDEAQDLWGDPPAAPAEEYTQQYRPAQEQQTWEEQDGEPGHRLGAIAYGRDTPGGAANGPSPR